MTIDTSKKIKVALCYSGAIRGLIINLPQIKNSIFHEDIFEIDYYLYGDPGGGTIRADDRERGKAEPQGLKIQKELPEFNCLLEDETIGFDERLQRFRKQISGYHMPYEQQVLQWYGVRRVFDFVFSQDKEYDIYVRLRPDIFPAGKMKFDWEHFDEDTVYAPFMGNFGGLNDRFAFGSKKAMSVYSQFYESDIYYNGPDAWARSEALDYFDNKLYKTIPVEHMRPNISDEAERQQWRKEHRDAYVFGCGQINSEFRLLNYLIDAELDIVLLDPAHIHIGAVRSADGQIRYGGPEFEGMLLHYEQAVLEDLNYDRKWWNNG